MELVDANILLRYFLKDNSELSGTAREVVETQTIQLHFEVVAEVVYVLLKTYFNAKARNCWLVDQPLVLQQRDFDGR